MPPLSGAVAGGVLSLLIEQSVISIVAFAYLTRLRTLTDFRQHTIIISAAGSDCYGLRMNLHQGALVRIHWDGGKELLKRIEEKNE